MGYVTSFSELPPRARRILADATVVAAHNGTTSACAENTGAGILQGYAEGNYLRVRGEYSLNHFSGSGNQELPPRARRIPLHFHFENVFHGTTSACAENTFTPYCAALLARNYLRVRGEYPK